MKRRLAKLVMFLLLGAIVNVAVAWACASRSTNVAPDAVPTAAEITWLSGYRPDMRGLRVHPGRSAAFGRRADSFFLWPEQRDDGLVHPFNYWMDRCGWPLLCFFAQSPHDEWAAQWVSSPYNEHTGYLRIESELLGTDGELWLPARPLAWAFAINTLFYAGILWLLYAVPLALRRRRRIKRGLCPACAYPVGESDLCTECGEPVRPRRGVGV